MPSSSSVASDVAPWIVLGLNWTPSEGDGDEEESMRDVATLREALGKNF